MAEWPSRAVIARIAAPIASISSPPLLLRARLDGRDMNRFEDLSIQLKRSLTQQECDINATGLYRKWYVL
ncbi:MAG: hypothetical protein H7138_09435, partial [Myxococcales bacterium]|nr:hypothetical protein [Myxococcales bacterium]